MARPSETTQAAALCGLDPDVLDGLKSGRYRIESNVFTHRHVARGSDYQVVATALLQNATGRKLVEGDEFVVYRTHAESWWIRHREEFDDGRFELLRRPKVMADPLANELQRFVHDGFPDGFRISVPLGLLRRLLRRIA